MSEKKNQYAKSSEGTSKMSKSIIGSPTNSYYCRNL